VQHVQLLSELFSTGAALPEEVVVVRVAAGCCPAVALVLPTVSRR
jgi:hypothetical protein